MLIREGMFAGLRRKYYRAILVDPPWKYITWSAKGMDRSPDQHYSTMTVEELCQMPIRSLIAKDTVLFMWIIDTHLMHALTILKRWGFTYKTVGFYWAKTNRDGTFFMGNGYWTRANPECMVEAYFGEEQEVERCFLATVGHPGRRETGKNVRRLLVSQRREHSRKPEDTRERIEALVEGPYLELFARAYHPGWSVWGNELDKFGNPELEALI